MDASIDVRVIERAERAERKRRARDFVYALREMSPTLFDSATMIDAHWFEIEPATQDLLVKARDRIVALTRGVSTPEGPLQKLVSFGYAITLAVYEPDMMRWAFAASLFVQAVNGALARERHYVRRAEAHGELIVGEGLGIEVELGDLLRSTG